MGDGDWQFVGGFVVSWLGRGMGRKGKMTTQKKLTFKNKRGT
jgi:hypothetical protein